MGNHSIDCDFCGSDRRLFGESIDRSTSYCCLAQFREQQEEQTQSRKKLIEDRVLFDKYGIYCYESESLGQPVIKVSTSDVIKFLKRLENGT